MRTLTTLSIPTADTNATFFEYAGFWQRFFALWIDAAILGVIQWPFEHMLGTWLDPNGSGGQSVGPMKEVLSWTFAVVIWWLYFAWFESSAYRATLGKRVLGIVVVDLQGNRLTFARASVRALAR
jgi:uncharacterized RDD family membrane protein YckC